MSPESRMVFYWTILSQVIIANADIFTVKCTVKEVDTTSLLAKVRHMSHKMIRCWQGPDIHYTYDRCQQRSRHVIT